LAKVADVRVVPFHEKDVKLLAVGCMITDRLVAGSKFHISPLTFAVVMEELVSLPPVPVPEWLAGLACKKEDHGMVCWRADTASLLSPKHLVQLAPFVQSANLKPVAQMDETLRHLADLSSRVHRGTERVATFLRRWAADPVGQLKVQSLA
jgi:hypothetical protein